MVASADGSWASAKSLRALAAVVRRLDRRLQEAERVSAKLLSGDTALSLDPSSEGPGRAARVAGGGGTALGAQEPLATERPPDSRCLMFMGLPDELYQLAGRFGAVPLAAATAREAQADKGCRDNSDPPPRSSRSSGACEGGGLFPSSASSPRPTCTSPQSSAMSGI